MMILYTFAISIKRFNTYDTRQATRKQASDNELLSISSNVSFRVTYIYQCLQSVSQRHKL